MAMTTGELSEINSDESEKTMKEKYIEVARMCADDVMPSPGVARMPPNDVILPKHAYLDVFA